MVVGLPELRKVRNTIHSHLIKAQQDYEHVLHDENVMRSMDGFCHHSDASVDQASMTLISMPFIQLEEHRYHTETKLSPTAIITRLFRRPHHSHKDEVRPGSHNLSAHPTRTLFQYLNPRENGRRDLKQVVCHMLGPRNRRYLCVSQVWILIVNEGESDSVL